PAIVARGHRRRTRFVEARREALVLLVGGQGDHAAIDQLLVHLPALDEVARIGVEVAITEYDRDTHLVAACELDVHARRILGARREASVEGRLVPVEVDAGGRLAPVPLGLGRVERRPRRRRSKQERHQCPPPPHLGTSSSETIAVPFPVGPSSAVRAVTFFNSSLPTKGRHWNSQSLPPTKPNSTSQGRGAPLGSLAGSSFSLRTRPAPTSSVSSGGCSTRSLPVEATIELEPPGCSMRRHGDLKSVTTSTPSGDQRSVSAGVPSTAPPTPSEVATSIFFRSPVSGSPVTRPPAFSDGTDSRMTTDGSTQRGASMRV